MMLTFAGNIPTHVNEPLFRLFQYYFGAKIFISILFLIIL